MSKLNIKELKAAALAATPIEAASELLECDHCIEKFHALANPATILALIERLQVAEDAAKRASIAAVWPIKESTREKVLNTILWFYHRAKPTYGTLPFAEEAIALLNAPLSTDAKDAEQRGIYGDDKMCDIGAETYRACEQLPIGYEIVIELENGCGSVSLRNPNGETLCIEGSDYFGGDIKNAIDQAIDASSVAKEPTP